MLAWNERGACERGRRHPGRARVTTRKLECIRGTVMLAAGGAEAHGMAWHGLAALAAGSLQCAWGDEAVLCWAGLASPRCARARRPG